MADSTSAGSDAPDSISHQTADSAGRQTGFLEPGELTEGTIAWLRIGAGAPGRPVGGRAAGEPLHFDSVGAGEYRALIGVPIAAADSLPVSLYLARGEMVDTMVLQVRVRRGGYPQEHIAVAPAFVKPDKAAVARIKRELVKSRAVSRRSHTTPRLWRGTFQLPRPSRITSGFGSARLYNGEVKSRHLGTDFAGAVGAPVRAAGRGVVALVEDFYLAGRSVYLDHGKGLVTTYFHLSRVDVAVGDTVNAGQRIGRVGRSGRVTGPHLHWAARYGRIAVNPMTLLDLEPELSADRSSPGEVQPGGE